MVQKPPPKDAEEGPPQEPNHPDDPDGQAPHQARMILDFEPVYRAPPPEDSESEEESEEEPEEDREDLPEIVQEAAENGKI